MRWAWLLLIVGACSGEAVTSSPESVEATAAGPATQDCGRIMLPEPAALGFTENPREEDAWTRGAPVLAEPIERGTLAQHPTLASIQFLRLSQRCMTRASVDTSADQFARQTADYAASPFGVHNPDMNERYPVHVERILDRRSDTRDLIAFRVSHPDGVPPGWIRDEVRGRCFLRLGSVMATLELNGPSGAEMQILADLPRLCDRLVLDRQP